MAKKISPTHSTRLQFWVQRIDQTIKSLQWHEWLVILLVLAGGFLRLFNLEASAMFLGDQGRDALIVSRIFTERDPVFIGPVSSVGNLYLGPLYYYFMLPFLWLTYPSPMGPVYAIALLGTATIVVAYLVARLLFGVRVGLLSAVLIAFNPALISLSRFSWNPNPEPIISLIWFWFLVMAWQNKRWAWLGVALCVAILAQLHYVTLILAGVSIVIWFIKLIEGLKKKNVRSLIAPTAAAAVLVILFQIPLLLFDFRHDWLNMRSFASLLIGDAAFSSTSSMPLERLTSIIGMTRARSAQVLVEYTIGGSGNMSVILGGLVLAVATIMTIKERKIETKQILWLLLFIFGTAIAALSIYKNDVYLHYVGFLIPLSILLLSFILAKLSRGSKIQAGIIILLIVYYSLTTVSQLSAKEATPSMRTLQLTADSIHQHIRKDVPYGLLLLSESKDHYGMNYRYYLSIDQSRQPLDPEQFATAKSFVVIQEDESLQEPLKVPLYELLVFDVATPSATWKVEGGPTIFVLDKDPAQTILN